MTCSHARSLFSPYLDGALTGRQMHSLADHFSGCGNCRSDYAQLQATQKVLAGIGKRPVPPELALRLRVAISRERAATRRPRWQAWGVQLENALNAFMVPATAGLLSAVVMIGLLFGFFALPASLQANNDVPTVLYTPPQLANSPYFMSDLSDHSSADVIVVRAYVDANGRVQDYKVLSGDAHSVAPQLENILIFTTFRPATQFGQPISGWTVLSFSKMTVKG